MIFFTAQIIFFTLIQVRISKELIGSATGLMNGIGNGLGIVGPILIGIIYGATHSYDLGILSLSIISIVGGLVFYAQYKENDELLIGIEGGGT